MDRNLIFRQAALQDLAELADLSVKTFHPAFASLNSEANMRVYMKDAFSEEQLSTELTNPQSVFFFLVQADGRPAGYLKLNFGPAQTDLHDPDSLEIQRIYVLPQFQGQKLGEQMIRKAVAVARENRLSYIWLGVWEKNTRAVRFYEHHGFTVVGSHPFPFGDEIQTDLIMKRPV
ncbi:MAG TPA: GNAT family N-acetyltransferase [Sphingobacteriaceae bacterium]